MRRALDFLRRAARLRPRPGRRRQSAVALSWRSAADHLAGASRRDAELDPPASPTSRTDLTPKDLARVEAITKPTGDFSKPEQFELMQGGAGTSKKRVNQDAFSHSSANLTFEEEGTFKLGNGLFRKLWVSSPSSTQASDGLGPLFNARACQSCHLKDGRGHPPEGNPDATSMFLRLARAAETEEEKAALADRRSAQLSRSGLWRPACRTLPCPALPAKAAWRSPMPKCR